MNTAPPNTSHVFTHERLDVYRASIDFVAIVMRITHKLPRGSAAIRDQLRRAAMSIPLNIAEACGRPGENDAARHYGIARGSALECAAGLDVLRTMDLAASTTIRDGREVLVRIVQMLSKMCR